MHSAPTDLTSTHQAARPNKLHISTDASPAAIQVIDAPHPPSTLYYQEHRRRQTGNLEENIVRFILEHSTKNTRHRTPIDLFYAALLDERLLLLSTIPSASSIPPSWLYYSRVLKSSRPSDPTKPRVSSRCFRHARHRGLRNHLP